MNSTFRSRAPHWLPDDRSFHPEGRHRRSRDRCAEPVTVFKLCGQVLIGPRGVDAQSGFRTRWAVSPVPRLREPVDSEAVASWAVGLCKSFKSAFPRHPQGAVCNALERKTSLGLLHPTRATSGGSQGPFRDEEPRSSEATLSPTPRRFRRPRHGSQTTAAQDVGPRPHQPSASRRAPGYGQGKT